MMESFPLSLHNSLLGMIVQLLVNEIPEILLLQHLNEMLLLLCFLDEPKLDSIYGFLDSNINVSCGLSCLCKGVLHNKVRANLVSYERVDLSDDFPLLILDKRMLSGHVTPQIDDIERASRNVNHSNNDEAFIY